MKIKRKNLEVNTTSYSDTKEAVKFGYAKIESWYVGNGDFGIMASREDDFEKSYPVDVVVSIVFPGTHEEWNNHIRSCIEQKAIEELPTFTNGWDEKSLDF